MGEDGKGRGSPGDLFLKVKIQKPLLEKIKGLLASLTNQINSNGCSFVDMVGPFSCVSSPKKEILS
jgi:hypothetical protein